MGIVSGLDSEARRAISETLSRLDGQTARRAEQGLSTLGQDVATFTRKPAETAAQQVATRAAAAPSVPLLTHDPAATKKVMITYLSAGNGHRTAAEALYGRLKEMFPQWEITRPVDMADLSRFGKTSASLFYKTVDWGMWPWMYNRADQTTGKGLFTALGRKISTIGDKPFVDMVHQQNPDVIIHTNVLGAELQSEEAKMGHIATNIQNLQVVTDMDGHATLAHSNADLTFAPSQKIADILAAKGLDRSKIAVTGIPINPVFSEPVDRAAVRSSLGLAQDAKVLLAQGNLIKDGSAFEKLMQNLAATYPDGAQGKPIQVVVACGKNEQLLAQLQEVARHYTGKIQLKPMGMLSPAQMRDVMGASDLTLTKPGGLTTAESMAMKLPMVLIDVMGGGQETKNAEYFAKQGAAVTTHDFNGAISQAVRLIADPAKLGAMRQAAAQVARPDASRAIGQIVSNLPAKAPVPPRQGWLSRVFG